MGIVAALVLFASVSGDPPAGAPQAQLSDFDFARTWDGPCTFTKERRGPDPAFAEACKQWSEPQYFHGIWEVGFETSNFTFMGKMECFKMWDHSCIELRGDALPWPKSSCSREFELKFIGRRSRYPVPGHLGSPTYAVTVDKLLYARKLPPPYNWRCGDEPEDE